MWMPRNQHRVVDQEYCCIAVMLGLNLEHGIRREILKKHPPSISDWTLSQFISSLRLGWGVKEDGACATEISLY